MQRTANSRSCRGHCQAQIGQTALQQRRIPLPAGQHFPPPAWTVQLQTLPARQLTRRALQRLPRLPPMGRRTTGRTLSPPAMRPNSDSRLYRSTPRLRYAGGRFATSKVWPSCVSTLSSRLYRTRRAGFIPKPDFMHCRAGGQLRDNHLYSVYKIGCIENDRVPLRRKLLRIPDRLRISINRQMGKLAS